MLKALRVFSLILLMVLVPGLAASSTKIYLTQPCVRWGDWTIGQSTGSGNTLATTFIANSEKTACVKVNVKYCENQSSAYVYPIERFDFEITMNNGFTVRKQVETTSGPDASEFSSDTTFSVDAMLAGPADTETIGSCNGLNGRDNTPMAVTIKFKGYSSDFENPVVTHTKTWTQDTVDMLRQEYVDMTPPGSRAELPVPAREEFKSEDQFNLEISSNDVDDWNTGHYTYMIDDGLKAKKDAWLSEVNEYRKANKKAVFSDRDFKVNSAYRNPYHQRFHVEGSFHSRHCYGNALDVETLDVDGDGGKPEQVKVVGEHTKENLAKYKALSDDGVLKRTSISASTKRMNTTAMTMMTTLPTRSTHNCRPS